MSLSPRKRNDSSHCMRGVDTKHKLRGSISTESYYSAALFFFFILFLSYLIPESTQAQEAGQVPQSKPTRFEYSTQSMGSNLAFIVYAASDEQATRAITASLERLDDLSRPLNNYNSTSEVSTLSSLTANERVRLSPPLADVLTESKRWLELSQGKFDVASGRLMAAWRVARKSKSLPSETELLTAREKCGWQYVDLHVDQEGGSSISFRQSGIVLDVAGIATGYLLDRMMSVLVENGIQSALIDAGGDILVSDPPPGKDGWSIDVAGISKKSAPLLRLSLRNCAVTTSGDLNQFIEIDGRRYSHLIDPTRAVPVEGRQSVTVVAKRAVDADAGATALAILGADATQNQWPSLPLDQAIFITQPDDSEFPTYRKLLR
jgi:thiamine biosynthesis lipoprotein